MQRREFLMTATAALAPIATLARSARAASPLASQASMISIPFYGINGHVNQGGAYQAPFQLQRDLLLDLGVQAYRNDVWDELSARRLGKLDDAFDGSGIMVLPCMTPGLPRDASELDAYRIGYQMSHAVATVLKGRIAVYECGNELENDILVSDGNKREQYNPILWPAYRGLIRGLVDGVRRADPSAKVGVDAGWLHFGALRMLWNGENPLSPERAEPIRWDITMYHWYSDMGNILRAKGVDVLDSLMNSFGKPIWITEFGFRPNGNTHDQANYITNAGFGEFSRLRKRYDVQSAYLYELFDMQAETGYGLLTADGKNKKPAYYVLREFIAANPMPPARI